MRLILLLLLFSSCSPEARLNRLVKNNPHLLVKDTIVVKDTIKIKGSVRDSTFIFSKDTIVISDSNQVIKYFYNTTTKNHYIKGEVRDRVVEREIKVPYDKVIVKPLTWWQENSHWMTLIFFILTAILVYFKNR
jgi:hypothetical protein